MSVAETDRGLLLGDGLFETLRVEAGRPLLFERHLARLERSAALLGFTAPLDRVRKEAADALGSTPSITGSMRITVTRGSGPRGLVPPASPRPTILVSLAAGGPRSTATVLASLSEVRRNAGSPSTQVKSLGYLDNILARTKAAKGCDDAVMLNTDDRPACTTIGNLLVLTQRGWVTPAIGIGGVLPGIVRDVLIEKGALKEAPVSVDQLKTHPLARSNSVVGVQPLQLIDGVAPDRSAIERLTRVLEAAETGEL